MDAIERNVGSATDSDGKTSIYWQHRVSADLEFNQQIFDDQWLADQGYVTNSPSAGRGASLFLNINRHQLVLRHYRRGGMVRSISEGSYIWLGLHRTRAWREFGVLCALEQLGLPAPRPYSCQVKRTGLVYSASLITFYLDGLTLAERICTARLDNDQWFAIGRCIRQFHISGVNHADLNAHNILFDDAGHVSLIDFDRATISRPAENTRIESNLKRLKRSLDKIGSSGPAHYDSDCWNVLIKGYDQGLIGE